MTLQDKSLLTFIDVQGKLSDLMDRRKELFGALEKLIRGFKILDIPILWLEQLPEKLGPTRPELAELLEPLRPIPKSSFSAWGCEEYRRVLGSSRRRHIFLCGIETHICVYQTARDMLKRGYQINLLVG